MLEHDTLEQRLVNYRLLSKDGPLTVLSCSRAKTDFMFLNSLEIKESYLVTCENYIQCKV